MSAILLSQSAAQPVVTMSLTVPYSGAWVAELQITGTPPAAGAQCVVRVLGADWHGTVVGGGGYAERGLLRVVGGRAAWGHPLRARGYHSDAGVRGRTVVEDLARDAGEDLAPWGAGDIRLGTDYARRAGAGAGALTDALRGVPWWVGSDGRTYCQERPTGAATGALMAWSPETRSLCLGLGVDLGGVLPGAVLSDPLLGGSVVLREVRFELDQDGARAWCWAPLPEVPEGSRLTAALVQIADRLQPRRYWGKYRYRVAAMGADGRVECAVVDPSLGLPDLAPLQQWPGIAGAHAVLTVGSQVLVEFVDGDPAQPIVTAYAPKDSTGYVPVSVSLDGGTAPVARAGDPVTVFLSAIPVPVVGTLNGASFVGTATFASPIVGIIGAGNPRVLA